MPEEVVTERNDAMLEKVLSHLHNRFEHGFKVGVFEVTDNTLQIAGLKSGQYFWILGSVFNDGLHREGDNDLVDEEFNGKVYFLAVPKAVIELAADIASWCEDNAETLDSPYQSESFDGYSYSKAGGGNGTGEATVTWQSHFRTRLTPWRKLSW